MKCLHINAKQRAVRILSSNRTEIMNYCPLCQKFQATPYSRWVTGRVVKLKMVGPAEIKKGNEKV